MYYLYTESEETDMIGEKIKERRTALNLTQEELAQKLGYKSKSARTKEQKKADRSAAPEVKNICEEK